MAYVDLNPVRAKTATTPEASEYTSIKDRIEAYLGTTGNKQKKHLMPLRVQGQNLKEAIPYPLSSYFALVDWSGRMIRTGKPGRITEDVPPILVRLGINPDEWLATMSRGNRFHRAVGKLRSLKVYAESLGKQWLHGITASSSLYHSSA